MFVVACPLIFLILSMPRETTPLLRAVEQGGFFGDQALVVEFQHSHVEGLPAERCGSFDDFVEGLAFGFPVFDRSP